MKTGQDIRLGADIGGTFTDVVLDIMRNPLFEVLTSHDAPEQAIPDGTEFVTGDAGIYGPPRFCKNNLQL